MTSRRKLCLLEIGEENLYLILLLPLILLFFLYHLLPYYLYVHH